MTHIVLKVPPTYAFIRKVYNRVTAMDIASIGFRAKTGKAIAVALALKDSRPSYLARWEVSLCDSQVPEKGQPHQAVMELTWSEVGRTVAPIEARIETIAADRLSVLSTQDEAMGAAREGSACSRAVLPDQRDCNGDSQSLV
jgi:hypothetical protein